MRMEQILAVYQKNDFSQIPENGFILTFDDGYIDHYEVVYPILKEAGVQGVFSQIRWRGSKTSSIRS